MTNSYILAEQELYTVGLGFADYKKFLEILKTDHYDILHIHAVGKETFSIYALIARIQKVKVVLTLHTSVFQPNIFSYTYIVTQLCTRFLYNHIICTSKYILQQVKHHHIASRFSRSLIYQGVDRQKIENAPSKEFARSYIYKRLGIAFTKNIRMVGMIANTDKDHGIEHVVDALYLADTYKNLTNTICIILVRGVMSKEVHAQIRDMGVEGICFLIEEVEDPEGYIKAFDIFISPRTAPGDLYVLLTALSAGIPCVATKVGDTREFESYTAVPLVPPSSAKYLTEALMHIVKHEKPVVFKAGIKSTPVPKKFTKEYEKIVIKDVYMKVLKISQSIRIR